MEPAESSSNTRFCCFLTDRWSMPLSCNAFLQGGPAPAEKPKKKQTVSAPSAVDRIPVLKLLQVILPIIVAGLAYMIFFGGATGK